MLCRAVNEVLQDSTSLRSRLNISALAQESECNRVFWHVLSGLVQGTISFKVQHSRCLIGPWCLEAVADGRMNVSQGPNARSWRAAD